MKARRQFLEGGLGTRDDHLDALRAEGEVLQRRGGHLAGGQKLRGRDGAQILQIGLDAADRGLRQRGIEGGDGGGPVLARHDHFGEHGIVIGGDLGAGLDPAVDAGAFGEFHLGEEAGGGLEIGVGDFRIKAHLHGGALGRKRPGGGDGVFARRLADHPFHEVDAEHRLGDRMLHLQAGVHLQEVEFLPLRVVDELHRAGALIGDALAQLHRRRVQAGAHFVREEGGGGLLHHLLVPPLEGAVPLAQRHHLALAIAEDLHFHMARLGHEALQIDPRIAEGGMGGALHPGEGVAQLDGRMAQVHADAAAAGGGFQHHRIGDALGGLQGLLHIGEEVGARQERHARGLGQFAGRVLEAEGLQMLRLRPDETDALRRQSLGEGHILGQEAVAGMDRIGPRRLAGGDDGLDIQVAFGGRGGAEAHGLVRLQNALGEAVGVGIDRDRGHV